MIANLRMTIMIANLRVTTVTTCQFHVIMFQSIHHATGNDTGKPKKANSVLTEVIVKNIHEATVVSSIIIPTLKN